ncbi:MAG: hypothetical protein U0169_24210 [Polyangiaceae bacterium]
MTLRTALRVFAACVLVWGVAFLGVRSAFRMRPLPERERFVVVSDYVGGRLAARHLVADGASAWPAPRRNETIRVVDEAVAAGRLVRHPEELFVFGVLPGIDGIEARIADRVEVFTPDDLRALELYDRAISSGSVGTFGFDTMGFYGVLALRFEMDVPRALREVRLRRLRLRRRARDPVEIAPDTTPTPSNLRESAGLAADYVARNVLPDGRFRYSVRPTDDFDQPGYSVPRHAGAAWFLAEAAAETKAPHLVTAAKAAAEGLRTNYFVRCGDDTCVGEYPFVDLGSSALTILAFTRLVASGIDESLRADLIKLTRFVRSMARPDGEFQHVYDIGRNVRLSQQRAFYTAEAALALARAFEVTGDRADRDVARAALHAIAGGSWSFPGSRHYFAEEHWTCQALDALWDSDPDPAALAFCEAYGAWLRELQFTTHESAYDAEGSYGIGSFLAPRYGAVAGRTEGMLGLYAVLVRSGAGPERTGPVREQIERSLALLLRHQYRPGPAYLFATPAAAYGGYPTSDADLDVRIDTPQHAGMAMLRYIRVSEPSSHGHTHVRPSVSPDDSAR